MQNRSALLGWLLAGAFSASVSCGGSGGGGLPGFGVACDTDKECTAYDLLCSTDDKKCVQCFNREDCKLTETCVAGKCQAPTSCDDSRDCNSNQVCSETAGVCVECLTNRDCPTGQKCAAQACVDGSFCEFTSDCEDGLLCDADAGICVSCRTDRDCPTNRVCTENECVTPGSGGSGGSDTAGTDAGGTQAGGVNNGGSAGSRAGSAGNGGNAGSGGSAGNGGSGGVPPLCECTLGDVCAPPDEHCVAPEVIDDFVECDDQILQIEGRSGPWYGAADTDVNITTGFGNPGTLWTDHTCAAWATGGLQLNGTLDSFAILAAILADGAYYDLSAYNGLQIVLESDNPVDVVLKTSVGLFRYQLSYIDGSNLRTVPFGSMVHDVSPGLSPLLYISATSEIQFAASDRTTFGFAVHHVQLY